MAARRPIRLPAQWPAHVKSGVLHAISLASVVPHVCREPVPVVRGERFEACERIRCSILLLPTRQKSRETGRSSRWCFLVGIEVLMALGG